MSLDGRTALITGESSGIGLATAKLFADRGARVVITSGEKEELAIAETEVGPQALAISANVRSSAELAALGDRIGVEVGHLDILFADAGVAFSTPIGRGLGSNRPTAYHRSVATQIRSRRVHVRPKL